MMHGAMNRAVVARIAAKQTRQTQVWKQHPNLLIARPLSSAKNVNLNINDNCSNRNQNSSHSHCSSSSSSKSTMNRMNRHNSSTITHNDPDKYKNLMNIIQQQQNRKFGTSGASNVAVDDDFFSETVSSKFFLPQKYRSKSARNRYSVGKMIGEGMFAKVYEAVDLEKNHKVAIKTMDKRTTPRDLCERELKIMNSVSDTHARITRIHNVYEDETHLYFVLELLSGDMFDFISEKGRLSEPEAASVTRKLCSALSALHRSNILHRDIKLENLLMDTSDPEIDSNFKIGDFGFAKGVEEEDGFKNPAGTLGYVAPEVLESRIYSPKTDLWAAGCALYIMLSGHPPFPPKPGVNIHELPLQEALEAELEAIHFGREKNRWNKHLQKGAWAKVSPGAKKLVSKMLRLDPKKRYSTEQVLNDPWILSMSKRRIFEYIDFE